MAEPRNGTLLKWILGVIAGLIVTISGVLFATTLARNADQMRSIAHLESRVAVCEVQSIAIDRRLERIEQKLDRLIEDKK